MFTATSVTYAARKSKTLLRAPICNIRSPENLKADNGVLHRPIYGLLKEVMPGTACEVDRMFQATKSSRASLDDWSPSTLVHAPGRFSAGAEDAANAGLGRETQPCWCDRGVDLVSAFLAHIRASRSDRWGEGGRRQPSHGLEALIELPHILVHAVNIKDMV
ncbi:hypothetical protein LTR10_017051 [Elasticomyces elasticus]|uniref:Uncharacterized protein n=1 Tax=Exophiala sideris TaxID=1016849 RepID=A0ABR0J0K0_9EURO|nr:hypothetical protein LTR10_017051 [Elasticomyces elasticus]KAK5023059.1 hypothetical protein LTS07_009552 [Exophiala sideris]KAK5026784.1 hypothetical protein LTR13_009824 [Exophiala sideris]KAK5052437.1 hypothetical protein LTR69_009775 [Exophiala sideris]KAK5178222.1 hypothetical protein LTR44_009306 [Eurotiomycetes sp. CCFEE 6388]